MKTRNRILSVLIAVVMLATSVNLAAFPSAFANGGAQSLEWDFNTAETQQQAEDKAFSAVVYGWNSSHNYNDTSDKQSNKVGTQRWQKVNNWETLQKQLQEKTSGNEIGYITVTQDFTEKTTDPKFRDKNIIHVTGTKVLDLNGHSITYKSEFNVINATNGLEALSHQENSDSRAYYTEIFDIDDGATLIVMDSSKEQTGKIWNKPYMLNIWKYDFKHWVARDIFNVSDGNLIILGGTFYAGRQQVTYKQDTWGFIKSGVGEAISLGTKIASYASGVGEAVAGLEDAKANFTDILKKTTSGAGDTDDGSQVRTSATVAEPQEPNPTGNGQVTGADNSSGANESRNQTTGAKNNAKNNSGTGGQDQQNQPNQNETAKKHTENKELFDAKKGVVSAVTGGGDNGIKGIVNDAFALVDNVMNFLSGQKKAITKHVLGTVVNVMNKGTFVSYGGTYYGHGMTENQRDGVIEVVKAPDGTSPKDMARAYIYDGEFYALAGANVFNILRKPQAGDDKAVTYTDDGGSEPKKQVISKGKAEMPLGMVPTMFNDTNSDWVDTSQIQVRGGTFKTACDVLIACLSGEKDDDEDPTTMVGYPGTVNLGVSSFGEDMIRDGRIQLNDMYGVGALVLRDDAPTKAANPVYHYRLVCTDPDLRSIENMRVYPNNDASSNSNYSMKLETRYGNNDLKKVSDIPKKDNVDALSQGFAQDAENERGVMARDERYFIYTNDKYASNFYVVPQFGTDDVYGQNCDTADCWYYKVPEQVNDVLSRVLYSEQVNARFKFTERTDQPMQFYSELDRADNIAPDKNNKSWQNRFAYFENNLFHTMKWFTYKIYKVDPLTMDNISVVSGVPGKDEPLGVFTYGTSTKNLQCLMPIQKMGQKLGITYKQGEMYRLVLEVSEDVVFGTYLGSASDRTYTDKNGTFTRMGKKSLKTAKTQCSIVFVVSGENEKEIYTNEKGAVQQRNYYTPLQWDASVLENKDRIPTNSRVSVNLLGKPGQVDRNGNKIFDIYYQWYKKNANGKDELIAGTDNVDKTIHGNDEHRFDNWIVNDGVHQYKNTLPLKTTTDKDGYIHPVDWTCEEIHTYTDNNYSPTDGLWSNPSIQHDYTNNNYRASGTDTLYIPASLAGAEIYCRAVVVNNYWPVNYDHVQTYYSSVITVSGEALDTAPGEDDGVGQDTMSSGTAGATATQEQRARLEANAEAKKNEENGDVSIFIPKIAGLSDGEKITKVTVLINNKPSGDIALKRVSADLIRDAIKQVDPKRVGRSRTRDMQSRYILAAKKFALYSSEQTCDAATSEALPIFSFPSQFERKMATGDPEPGSYYFTVLIESAKGEDTRVTLVNGSEFEYAIQAQKFVLTVPESLQTSRDLEQLGHKTIMYEFSQDLIDHADEFSLNAYPANANVNNVLIEGVNFENVNPGVAYMTPEGKLVLGDDFGTAYIYYNVSYNEDGSRNTYDWLAIRRFAESIEFSGVNAPQAGVPLDSGENLKYFAGSMGTSTEKDYRNVSNYDSIAWYADGKELAPGTVAEAGVSYTAQIRLDADLSEFWRGEIPARAVFTQPDGSSVAKETTVQCYNIYIGANKDQERTVYRFAEFTFDPTPEPAEVISSATVNVPGAAEEGQSLKDFAGSVTVEGLPEDAFDVKTAVLVEFEDEKEKDPVEVPAETPAEGSGSSTGNGNEAQKLGWFRKAKKVNSEFDTFTKKEGVTYILQVSVSDKEDSMKYRLSEDFALAIAGSDEKRGFDSSSVSGGNFSRTAVFSVEIPVKESTEIPPEETTTQTAPVETTSAVPVETTAATPVETTAAVPVETTAATPIETTAAVPVETTAATPIETTAATPVETTAPAPTEETTVPPTPAGEAFALGDVNRDGKVNARDARAALRISARLDPADDFVKLLCDADQDGRVKAGDARKILRHSAKLELLPDVKIYAPEG